MDMSSQEEISAPFTFDFGTSAPKVKTVFTTNAMSTMSQCVGQDIAKFLIHETAESKRKLIRNRALESLRGISHVAFLPLSVPLSDYKHYNRGFSLWEARKTNQHPENLVRKLKKCNSVILVKEAEGIWRYCNNYQRDLKNKEILSLSEFNVQFEASGFIVEEEDCVHYCYTSKSAYYQSRLVNTAKRYDEEMLKFTSEIKQVDKWENDMLSANNINADELALQSQDMYDTIIEAWETKARPFKVFPSKQTPRVIARCTKEAQSPPVFGTAFNATFNYPPDTSKKSPPAVTKTQEQPSVVLEKKPEKKDSITSNKPDFCEKFKSKEGTWKCEARCVGGQTPENTRCVACETSNATTASDTDGFTQQKYTEISKNEEEIAAFLELWDKYKHRLEEILVRRQLERLQVENTVQSSSERNVERSKYLQRCSICRGWGKDLLTAGSECTICQHCSRQAKC